MLPSLPGARDANKSCNKENRGSKEFQMRSRWFQQRWERAHPRDASVSGTHRNYSKTRLESLRKSARLRRHFIQNPRTGRSKTSIRSLVLQVHAHTAMNSDRRACLCTDKHTTNVSIIHAAKHGRMHALTRAVIAKWLQMDTRARSSEFVCWVRDGVRIGLERLSSNRF